MPFVERKQEILNELFIISSESPKNKAGTVVQAVEIQGLSKKELVDMYSKMVLIRNFEYTVKDLFARGTINGALHLYVGEEAIAVGAMACLNEDDYVTSTHRGHGHLIARGVDINKMMAELFGKETGLCRGKGGSMHMADMNLHVFAQPVVGAGLPLAVGAGLAAKLKGTKSVAISFFGDGGASQGCAHEAMNLAAIWKLPVVFICENNQYAEATKATYAIAGGSVAKRAQGYGIPGQTVDGMDVFAVYKSVMQAVARARRGEGPTLLECITYRFEGHEEGDPWQTYRTKAEVEEWKKNDPISKFGTFLKSSGNLSSAELDAIESAAKGEIENAIEFAKKSPLTSTQEAFTDVYSNS